MHFCSQTFLFFFLGMFALYWLLPWAQARVWLLLVGSFAFYATWNHWLALLIGVSSFIDYCLARGMDASPRPGVRRCLLIVSVVGNLCLLGYFKYANFFLESLQDALGAAGVSASVPLLAVIVPVGISFYTFEAINYMVDVYRGHIPAEHDLGHFMLFITFFPHLVAGPIVRARDFLPQIRRPKHWNWARLQLGVALFLMGLFKKLALADKMAEVADPIFASPDAYRTHTVWLGLFCYSIQVYCDFSGYTDMAIGLAHMFGYKLAPNFNMPYLAVNIAEFWRRWHISLSSWLRDYLFFPLGGSRGGEWLTARNLLITMTLAGLWHGAGWNYLLFGVAQGMLLVGHRWFRSAVSASPALESALTSSLGTVARVGVTFVTFCLTLVIFRMAPMPNPLDLTYRMYHRLFIPEGGIGTPMSATGLACLFLIVALGHCLGAMRWPNLAWLKMPWPAMAAGYCAALMAALILAPKSGQAFVYFQF